MRASLMLRNREAPSVQWPRLKSVANRSMNGRQVRQARSRPLLDDLERWLRTTLDTLSRKSDTAAAILYALKLRPALLRYCEDAAVEIDNSAAERALRGVAI